MSTTELLLIDLSGIAHQIWHVSGNEPDPSYVSTQVIARVRSLASAHPHAAICCDSGASFRRDLDPTYKANRDTANRAPLKHQMTVACETLAKDGFPVWSAPGFEADDVIATATMKALAIDDTTVLIASADKDLLQLVGERVKAKSVMTGNIAGPEEVVAKFGVRPDQMLDYLCLVGDTSDNIKGAVGIGAKTAAELLKTHGTLEAFYKALDAAQFPPDMKRRGKMLSEQFGIGDKQRESLLEFRERWPTVRKLVALRTDVTGFEFAEVAVEREAAPMVEDDMPAEQSMAAFVEADEREKPKRDEPASELSAADATAALGKATADVKERIAANGSPRAEPREAEKKDAIVASQGTAMQPAAPAPAEWELQLDPRSYRDVRIFAQDIHDSRKFMRNFGSPQAVIAAVVSGRELGVPAMASLRGFHSVEDGPPMPNADLVRSIVLKSGKVEYFEPTERSATAAEFVIKRIGRPEVKLRYTMEEGRTAYGFDVPMTDKERAELERKWQKSGWGKNPADMLVARASMKLGRLVCPDVCAGLYAKEEFD